MSPQIILLVCEALVALVKEAPQIKADIEAVIDLIRNGKAPSPEQLKAVQSIIDTYNEEIQNA